MLNRLATQVTTHLVLKNLSKSIGYSLSKWIWKGYITAQYWVVTQRSRNLKSLHSKCLRIAVRYWNCIRTSWFEWKWESHSPPTRTLRAFTNIESSQGGMPGMEADRIIAVCWEHPLLEYYALSVNLVEQCKSCLPNSTIVC